MERSKQKLYKILLQHVPENAVHYCLDLWTALPFHFKVTKARNSKLGDYRYDRKNKSHSISVNFNLNKYSFLITYIHEVAHLMNTERYGRRAAPHGKEWKACFKELMDPVLTDLIFPHNVLIALTNHLKNPKASTYADGNLVLSLRNYDASNHGLTALSELEEGDIFEFNKRMYKKMNIRRTRVLCQESESSKRYLISKMALVKNLKKGEQ